MASVSQCYSHLEKLGQFRFSRNIFQPNPSSLLYMKIVDGGLESFLRRSFGSNAGCFDSVGLGLKFHNSIVNPVVNIAGAVSEIARSQSILLSGGSVNLGSGDELAGLSSARGVVRPAIYKLKNTNEDDRKDQQQLNQSISFGLAESLPTFGQVWHVSLAFLLWCLAGFGIIASLFFEMKKVSRVMLFFVSLGSLFCALFLMCLFANALQ
jgi:hypothetical protein